MMMRGGNQNTKQEADTGGGNVQTYYYFIRASAVSGHDQSPLPHPPIIQSAANRHGFVSPL